MWVYRRTGHGFFEVGYYSPDGTWQCTLGDDYERIQDAAERVHYLNGGMSDTELVALCRAIVCTLGEVSSSRRLEEPPMAAQPNWGAERSRQNDTETVFQKVFE